VLAPSTISVNGTYGRYTKDTTDNNGIPHLSVPTCRSLSVHVPPPPYVPQMSHGHLDHYSFVSLSLRWLPAPCSLPWCPFPDAFCTLSIYPSMFFPICQHLFEVTDLTTCGYSFWWFQPPDTLYMLSRLYRKVNPFRSNLLLLLLLPTPEQGSHRVRVSYLCDIQSSPCTGMWYNTYTKYLLSKQYMIVVASATDSYERVRDRTLNLGNKIRTCKYLHYYIDIRQICI
jgi:hypothetical protein